MKLHLDQRQFDLVLTARNPRPRVCIDTIPFEFTESTPPGRSPAELTVNGQTFSLWRAAESDRVHVKLGLRVFSVTLEDLLQAATTSDSANEIRADMPGVAVAVRCEVGATVEAGAPLLVIESMKMQLTLVAPRAGVVAAVHVAENQSFQKGTVLVALQPGDFPR